jgi:very-short-patch-repair endonuclease
MESKNRFPLLRKILAALGLSTEAIDDIVERILDWLAEKKKSADEPPTGPPFHLRDDFLSRTEFSFCRVLMTAVGGRLVVCPKVNLGDLFFVATGDARKNRILLNRIDRKHVDFLLCDPATMRPTVGIELDDSSHQRPERQARDAWVDDVFSAAGLPLIRIPARNGYAVADVEGLVRPYLGVLAKLPPPSPAPNSTPARIERAEPTDVPTGSREPRCPKCGGPMAMRTAKSGPNAGGSFWGCQNYPRCRGIIAASNRPVL